jgi:hypothetical protein
MGSGGTITTLTFNLQNAASVSKNAKIKVAKIVFLINPPLVLY